jgi:hypothetical protein
VQPAGNHQVQHQPQIAFYSNRDTLADSPQFAHDAALHIRNGRLCGSKQKRARQAHSLDGLRDDAFLECTDIGGDIRQFRHAYQHAGRTRVFARPTQKLTRAQATFGVATIRPECDREMNKSKYCRDLINA